MKTLHFLIHCGVLLFATAVYGQFQIASRPEEAHVQASLIAEVTSIKPGETFLVGVRLQMDPGWHVYWKNPGESGLATQIVWNLPDGLHAGDIQWPTPHWYQTENPVTVTFGYEDEVVLLISMTPDEDLRDGGRVALSANVSWLACKETCIPGEQDIRLDLPITPRPPVLNAAGTTLFAQAQAVMPAVDTDWHVAAYRNHDTFQLVIDPPRPVEIKTAVFFPEKSDVLNYAAPQTLRAAGAHYLLTLAKFSGAGEVSGRLSGVLQIEAARGAAWSLAIHPEIREGDPDVTAASVTPASDASARRSNALIFLFAFLGGLILNIMPCVFPVLSIKIMGFVKQAEEGRGKALQHGLVFAFGVLVSFWILAGILIGLKASGEELGWGFQLQEPRFVVVMASLMFLFALSLFGVFEMGTSLMGVGGKVSSSGFTGSFLSGILATIIATPCTAPLMGTALGVTLTRSNTVAMIIFTCLGLGMASPYVLFTSMPGLLRFVPKPGAWMETFKQAMGFPMMATAVWLVWVLSKQAGHDAAAALMLGLLIIGMGSWVLGRWGTPARAVRTRYLARLFAVLFMVGGVWFGLPRENAGIHWEPFSKEAIRRYQAEGRPVFVDFTADWCLSCKTNELLVLHSKEVEEKFREFNVATVKADWTSRNEEITRALAEFNRNSVPLYVLYGRNVSESPRVLPEVLTRGAILQALESM